MTTTNKGALALRRLVDPQPDVTRADLAARLGLKAAAVGEWLRGKNRPSPEAMRQLEDDYGIPMRSWLEPAVDRAPDGEQPPDDGDGHDED